MNERTSSQTNTGNAQNVGNTGTGNQETLRKYYQENGKDAALKQFNDPESKKLIEQWDQEGDMSRSGR